MARKMRILIVDDSSIFRKIVRTALEGQADVEIAGEAADGLEALTMIKRDPPDIVSLDVEMPRMDGLMAMERIAVVNEGLPPQSQIGVIMLSAHTKKGADTTLRALESGAFDFITKPDQSQMGQMSALESLRRQFLVKARSFTSRRIAISNQDIRAVARPRPQSKGRAAPLPSKFGAIVIGVSTGGPRALTQMLPELTRRVDLPILIVQHMPPNFTESLAKSLDAKCGHDAVEVVADTMVKPKTIYLAPGGKHMVARKASGNEVVLSTNTNPPENGCRPSVDVLFRSAAQVWGGQLLAMVLTGMGNDGAKGLGPVKRAGAYVIAQDEETSVVWGMPGSAVETGHVDKVLPLTAIAREVGSIVNKG